MPSTRSAQANCYTGGKKQIAQPLIGALQTCKPKNKSMHRDPS